MRVRECLDLIPGLDSCGYVIFGYARTRRQKVQTMSKYEVRFQLCRSFSIRPACREKSLKFLKAETIYS
jgi:hypothetical protein